MKINLRTPVIIIIAIVIFLLPVLVKCTQLYTDWLWFQTLDFQRVFITMKLSDIGLRLACGAAFFVFLLVNLLLTRTPLLQAAQRSAIFREDNVLTIQTSPLKSYLTPKYLLAACLGGSFFMALLFSLSLTGDWLSFQNFLHPTAFEQTDPVFGRDIGFYVFKLPFYQFLFGLGNTFILISAFWVAVVYLLVSSLQGAPTQIFQSISARYHLSILAALFFLLKAVGYHLDQFSLLFVHVGAVWGLGYTTSHTTLLAYKILTYISLICAVTILVSMVMRRFKPVLFSIGFLVLAALLLSGVYPEIVQRFVVSPNEISYETPYLERNIQYTRQAYNLDAIEKKSFPAGNVLSPADIEDNRDTVNNIRLWDWEPLQLTYSQLQEIRTYYQFVDIDVDRYVIDGQYRQVMLAPRELNQDKLQANAKTWMNLHLTFTHGYGIAMSPVNEITGEGLPAFLLKDIPPVTTTDLEVNRPEIYYGEITDKYVIVNTKAKEFDYPAGDVNEYSVYEGDGGVKLSGYLRKALFALSFGDYKLLLSSDIDNDSRVLYYRNIAQRVRTIAPFLKFDDDPYIVLSEGKLYWMWDAYTTTNRYPYSEPFDSTNNYIRNSVKVVIDAYNGNTAFYISDPTDPIVQTYSKIFPKLFTPLSSMSDDLLAHIRYPNGLFDVQTTMYAVYHMEDPQIFYNKEDRWSLPTELYQEEERPMGAYYTIIKLPGEAEPEFVLIMPFTPVDKKNMISWLAARSDGSNYGKLLAFDFPKQELVYGPMQIEARINQDTTISQQLSLWNQRGTRVIRGNLLVIPVNDSLLYVEPLYLQAEQSRMPELRRVIVAHGDMVVMEPTLEQSLGRIFGSLDLQNAPSGEGAATAQEEQDVAVTSLGDLARRADQLFNEAQTKMRQGDWAGYGDTLNQLEQALTELVNRIEQQ